MNHLSIIINKNTTISFSTIEQTNKRIFEEMRVDERNCYNCVSNHSNKETLDSIIYLYGNFTEQEKALTDLRCSLCYFSLFNAILLFVVYGGPVSTNILTILDTILIIGCMFTNQIQFISLMESIIVLISFIVLGKVFICVYINLAVNILKQSKKRS